MKHKVQTFALVICQVFIALFIPGCQRSKSITISSIDHPDCDISFTEYEQYYSDQRKDAVAFIGTDTVSEFHTADSGCDISAYYALGKLYVKITDPDGNEKMSVNAEYNLDLSFHGFALIDDRQLLALISDPSGNDMTAIIDQGLITDLYGVELQSYVNDVISCDGGYLLATENSIASFKADGKSDKLYSTDNTICGVASKGRKIYTVESKPSTEPQTGRPGDTMQLNKLKLKELDLTSMSVKREIIIDYYSNNFEELLYGDASLFVKDDKHLLLSTREGIFDVDIEKCEAKTIVNTYDYGTELPPYIISDNGQLKTAMYYTGLDNQDAVAVSIINPSENAKKKISVCILGELYNENIFQYANRSGAGYYICLDKAVNGRFAAKDYLDIITNKTYDLIVFDDQLKDPLISEGYLLNLDNSSLNKDVINDGLSGLMDYCIFPEYSVNAYLYNDKFLDEDSLKELSYMDLDAKEIFAGQTTETIVDEYCGIILKEIDDKGSLSGETVHEMLNLCSKYRDDYYETESAAYEIQSGNMVFNSLTVRSVEELYSYFCYYPHCLGFCAPWGYESLAVNPGYYVGVSSSSSNVDDCIKILDLLLSDEVQRKMSFPVNKDSMQSQIDGFVNSLDKEKAGKILAEYTLFSDSEFDAYIDEINRIIGEMSNGTHNATSEEEQVSVIDPLCDKDSLEEFRTKAREFVADNNTLYRFDRTIYTILIEETNTYLSRNGDADQTVKVICDRVNKHVSESET